MDKWDEMNNRIAEAIRAKDEKAGVINILQIFIEFGRTLELISSDMDRLATAVEKITNQTEEVE